MLGLDFILLGKIRLKTPTDIAYYKILLVAGWDGGKILSLSLVAPQALVSSVLQLGNRHLAELRATWQQATWQGLVLTGIMKTSKMEDPLHCTENPQLI